MNEANLQRLIDHIDAIEEHIPDWLFHNCFNGMIERIEGRELRGLTSVQVIKNFLGVNSDVAADLSYRWSGDDPKDLFNINEETSEPLFTLAQQKEVIKHALETAKTGKVEWLH